MTNTKTNPDIHRAYRIWLTDLNGDHYQLVGCLDDGEPVWLTLGDETPRTLPSPLSKNYVDLLVALVKISDTFLVADITWVDLPAKTVTRQPWGCEAQTRKFRLTENATVVHFLGRQRKIT